MGGTKSWEIVKSKILVNVTMLEKIEDKDGITSLKVIGNKIFKMSGKEFRANLTEDENNKINHTIEIVNEKPKQFQINAIYILADGKKAWVYVEKPNS
jgi:hypothetical protein